MYIKGIGKNDVSMTMFIEVDNSLPIIDSAVFDSIANVNNAGSGDFTRHTQVLPIQGDRVYQLQQAISTGDTTAVFPGDSVLFEGDVVTVYGADYTVIEVERTSSYVTIRVSVPFTESVLNGAFLDFGNGPVSYDISLFTTTDGRNFVAIPYNLIDVDLSAFIVKLHSGDVDFTTASPFLYIDKKELYRKEAFFLIKECKTCLNKASFERLQMFMLRRDLLEYSMVYGTLKDAIGYYLDIARVLDVSLNDPSDKTNVILPGTCSTGACALN